MLVCKYLGIFQNKGNVSAVLNRPFLTRCSKDIGDH